MLLGGAAPSRLLKVVLVMEKMPPGGFGDPINFSEKSIFCTVKLQFLTILKIFKIFWKNVLKKLFLEKKSFFAKRIFFCKKVQ